MDRWRRSDFVTDLSIEEGEMIWGGLDLSSTIDITAWVIVSRAGEGYKIRGHYFIPADKLKNAEQRDKVLGEIEVGQIRKGVVGNITDFGAFVNLGGVDGLVHISDIAWGSVEKVSDVLTPGQEVEVKVLKIDAERRNIVISRRRLIEEERNIAKEALLSELKVGDTRKGQVKNLADFGAFVDLGGIDGLLHITDMSWDRVNHPSEVLSIDEHIEVKILNIDREREKIALGLKQLKIGRAHV